MESLQFRINVLQMKIRKLEEQIKEKDKHHVEMHVEMEAKKKQIDSLRKQNLMLSEANRRLKRDLARKEGRLNAVEDQYF